MQYSASIDKVVLPFSSLYFTVAVPYVPRLPSYSGCTVRVLFRHLTVQRDTHFSSLEASEKVMIYLLITDQALKESVSEGTIKDWS